MQGILKLPIELRCAILRELSTVEDLWSAVQSTRVLYEAFQLESRLMGSMTSAQIDTKLLPYVAALVDFDRSTPKDSRNRSRILEQFFSKSPSQAKEELAEISPREAVHAIDTYNAIKSFAEKYAAQAFALLQKEKVFDTSTPPFSPSEMHRIERSFYVFELFCVLYGKLGNLEENPLSPEREGFFRQAAPWENEQLACVDEFLIEQFRPGRSSLPHQVMAILTLKTSFR